MHFSFINDTSITEIYTLSLHDALPILMKRRPRSCVAVSSAAAKRPSSTPPPAAPTGRSEEHTSELQSHSDLVCRLLLEKKKHQQRRAGLGMKCRRECLVQHHTESHRRM